VVITFMFAMIYKLLPDVTLAWRNVWTGAAVTAVLFTIGKSLIGLYLGRGTVASVYGAAGSLIVILLWIYYSAQIVFGAEFTKVYSRRFEAVVVPARTAVPLTAEARAGRGMDRCKTIARRTRRPSPRDD
jgi:membrane protein